MATISNARLHRWFPIAFSVQTFIIHLSELLNVKAVIIVKVAGVPAINRGECHDKT